MIEWEGRQIPETLQEIVDPAHTVVIMHDTSRTTTPARTAWVSRATIAALTSRICWGRSQAFLDTARSHGVRVMYTQYTNLPNLVHFTDPRIPRELCDRARPGAALAAREQPLRH